MTFFSTRYGELTGITSFHMHENGHIKDCMLKDMVILDTPCGKLIPQYEYAHPRKRHIKSVSFYESGALKSLSLNQQTHIDTPLGALPAEFVTFYESGGISRLFPLNGQLSSYWDEDDEYRLAREQEFCFTFGKFKAKPIGIYFYEDGCVKGVTLWSGEIIDIATPIGKQKVCTGFSVHPNGAVKSFEPPSPIYVTSPIGTLLVSDPEPLTIYRDKYSVVFNEDGTLKSLITSRNKITVNDEKKQPHQYIPANIYDTLYGTKAYYKSLKIEFLQGKVCFKGKDTYNVHDCSFQIEPYSASIKPVCQECSDCGQCISG